MHGYAPLRQSLVALRTCHLCDSLSAASASMLSSPDERTRNMTQPDARDEDRTPPDVADEAAGEPDRAAENHETADDDVEGHAFTGALKDLKDVDRLA